MRLGLLVSLELAVVTAAVHVRHGYAEIGTTPHRAEFHKRTPALPPPPRADGKGTAHDGDRGREGASSAMFEFVLFALDRGWSLNSDREASFGAPLDNLVVAVGAGVDADHGDGRSEEVGEQGNWWLWVLFDVCVRVCRCSVPHIFIWFSVLVIKYVAGRPTQSQPPNSPQTNPSRYRRTARACGVLSGARAERRSARGWRRAPQERHAR